jgi:hypothetical protein
MAAKQSRTDGTDREKREPGIRRATEHGLKGLHESFSEARDLNGRSTAASSRPKDSVVIGLQNLDEIGP